MMEKQKNDKTLEKTGSTTNLFRVWKALFYSLDGLKATFRQEAAFRQELAIAVFLIPIAIILPLGLGETLLLVGSVFLVLITELLNSGLEWTVDYISTETHPLGKRIKDMGSAAVFLSLFYCGIVWVTIIWLHRHPIQTWLFS